MASTVLTGTACNGPECKGRSEDVTTYEKKDTLAAIAERN